MKPEGRSSKSEVSRPALTDPVGSLTPSGFWHWGDEADDNMILRDAPREDTSAAPELEERATRFGDAVVRFARTVPRGPVTDRLIDQLVGAATSLGANYSEAQDAVSRKDFRARVGISRKESKEAMFFLRMLAAAEPTLTAEARQLWREARELNRIFGAIWRK